MYDGNISDTDPAVPVGSTSEVIFLVSLPLPLLKGLKCEVFFI